MQGPENPLEAKYLWLQEYYLNYSPPLAIKYEYVITEMVTLAVGFHLVTSAKETCHCLG